MCAGLCPFILETETYQGGPQCGPQCGPWASAGPLPAPEAFPLSRTSAFNGRMAIVPSGKRGLRPLVLSCILFLVPKSHGAATKAAAQMRACQPPRFSLPHPPEPAGSACLLPATAGDSPWRRPLRALRPLIHLAALPLSQPSCFVQGPSMKKHSEQPHQPSPQSPSHCQGCGLQRARGLARRAGTVPGLRGRSRPRPCPISQTHVVTCLPISPDFLRGLFLCLTNTRDRSVDSAGQACVLAHPRPAAGAELAGLRRGP